MSSSQFKISLRLRHQQMDPASITAKLAIQPIAQWCAGDRRRTPKGRDLVGVHEESYWVSQFEPRKSDEPLDEFISSILGLLEKHSDFMKEFHSTGGDAVLYVSWFDPGGARLDWRLLSRLVDLSLGLEMDVHRNS